MSLLKKYRYGGSFITSTDNPTVVLWFNPCNKCGKIVIATEPSVFVGGLSVDLYSGNEDVARKVLSKSIFYLVEYKTTKQIYDLAIKIGDLESAAGHTQSSYSEPLGGCLEDGIVIDKDEAKVTVACGPAVYDLPVSYFNGTIEMLQCVSFTLNGPRGTAAVDKISGEFSVWDLCTWDIHYPKLKFAPWLFESGFYHYSIQSNLLNSRSSSRSGSRKNSISSTYSSRSSSRRNSTCMNFNTQYISISSLHGSNPSNNLKRKRKPNSLWISKKLQKVQSENKVLSYSDVVKLEMDSTN